MLFKILYGDKARISTDITPYHEGYCYVTYDGDFYVDMNNERVKLSAKDAETLAGMSLDEIKKSINYNDLINKPTIPTVNNGTLTIQKNGTTVKTFTANSSSNVTANITVPTKVSELTNDSKYLTSYTETDPTVPAWAKEETKPSYNLGEVSDTSSYVRMTPAERTKLSGIATGANKYTHPNTHAASMITGLATVATSGSYNDLSNKPTIPAAVTVDTALSSTSTNPVQNKVINTALGNKVDKVSGKGLSTNDLTAALKTNYDTAYTHSQSAHAPSGAEVNQNAFSNVKIGTTTIAADTKTDTIEFAGSNVTITPDATNDKVTFGITKDNVTAALGYTPPTTDTTYSAAGSSLGLVKSGGDVTISSGVITVKDDSHNHTIANVDNLQATLDAKATKQDVTDVVNSLAGGDIIVDYANCAECDEARNNIIDTYATKQSLSNLQRHLTDDQLTVNEGLLTVARAKQDANGNVITKTYQTKSDSSLSTTAKTIVGAINEVNSKTSSSGYTHPTYTARTGKPTANQTPAFGGTATVSQITSDGTGHVTGATDRTITIPSTLSNGTGTAGLIKTSSSVTSSSGYTACPVISGVPYYKNTTYPPADSSLGLVKSGGDVTISSGVITVKDDSHNHTIANVDGLQTTLDGKASTDSVVSIRNGLESGRLVAKEAISALHAVNDGDGNDIVDTYATKQDVTDVQTAFMNGSAIVGLAESANFADRATDDSAGNKIVDTYATKTEIAKLNYTNIAYGTCSTAAGTAAKVIKVTGNTNWSLAAGSLITVLFSATNTASKPTFNVNGTGAKNVFYGTSQIATSNLSYAGYKNRPMNFMYDGTQYRFIGWGYDGNSDAKTTTSNLASTKLYLVGAKTQSTSGQTTYSNSSAYVGTDNCLYSGGAKVATESYVTSAIASAITTALNTGV